jgi:hypothetical protein
MDADGFETQKFFRLKLKSDRAFNIKREDTGDIANNDWFHCLRFGLVNR